MIFSSRTTSIAATAAASAASVLAFPFLPDRVATHFDAEGRPDRYSSRIAAVVMLPGLMAGLTVLNDRLGGWPGGNDREDVDSGAQARDEAIGLAELALLPSHLALLAKGVGLPVDMSRVGRGIYGLLMIGLGNVLPKLPRNGLIGIRTPWTLADPTVWERTHRVGGYLLMGAGVVSLLSLPSSSKRVERLSMAATLGAVGLSVAYSLLAYTGRDRLDR